VTNLTASAKRTAEQPGQNHHQNVDLNRAILDTAPDGWLSLLTCKAAETGGRVILVDPRSHRPSQTDLVEGSVRKEALSDRSHVLPDRRVIGRDQTAAWVLWSIGQRIMDEEQARSNPTETVARAT
jgi:putative transposase